MIPRAIYELLPFGFQNGNGFPVLSHRLASNRRIFMKFIYGSGVMMHVKIYKCVIGCREVIALCLPKHQ